MEMQERRRRTKAEEKRRRPKEENADSERRDHAGAVEVNIYNATAQAKAPERDCRIRAHGALGDQERILAQHRNSGDHGYRTKARAKERTAEKERDLAKVRAKAWLTQ